MSVKTILVIDDDKNVTDSTASVLEDLDYKVVVINNGIDALEWLAYNPIPDLVITDFKMVGRGDGVAQSVRRLDIPIVMITGCGLEAQDACEKQQVNIPIFAKPLDYDALARIVERYIGKSDPDIKIAC